MSMSIEGFLIGGDSRTLESYYQPFLKIWGIDIKRQYPAGTARIPRLKTEWIFIAKDIVSHAMISSAKAANPQARIVLVASNKPEATGVMLNTFGMPEQFQHLPLQEAKELITQSVNKLNNKNVKDIKEEENEMATVDRKNPRFNEDTFSVCKSFLKDIARNGGYEELMEWCKKRHLVLYGGIDFVKFNLTQARKEFGYFNEAVSNASLKRLNRLPVLPPVPSSPAPVIPDPVPAEAETVPEASIEAPVEPKEIDTVASIPLPAPVAPVAVSAPSAPPSNLSLKEEIGRFLDILKAHNIVSFEAVGRTVSFKKEVIVVKIEEETGEF